MARTGNSDPKVVLATVITSYAMSSIITGIVFFCLGAFKLGRLVNFFPRHILIGCIGGVGFFLFVTGIEVSARLDGNFEYNLTTLKHLLKNDTIALWMTPLVLAILLMVLKRFSQSAYVVPTFFIAIAGVFYVLITAISSLNLPNLRDQGWIFPQIGAGVPFYHFYSYYGMSEGQSNKPLQLLMLSRLPRGRLESTGFNHTCNVRSNVLRHTPCPNQCPCSRDCSGGRRS